MVKFHLDKKNGPESPIFLSLHHRGKRIKVYTGKKIDALKWDVKTCRANPKKYKTNCIGFNAFLNTLDNAVQSLVNENRPISKGDIKAIIDKANGKDNTTTFFGFSENYIAQQISKGELETLSSKAYYGTLNHLKQASPGLTFEGVDLNFFDKFVSSLRNKGLSTNSIGGHIKRLKWFMAAALDRDLHSNVAFKKKAFAAAKEETDQIYLTRKEIRQLMKKSLSKRLKNVADAFVINCHLGQRYSDLAQMQKGNFRKDHTGFYYWHIVQGKGNNQMQIPVPREVMPLLRKYKFTCPVISGKGKLMSVQKFNKYLKEAAAIAELNAMEDVRSGSEVKKLPKHELIKSHTARRSFATNLYLEGVPTQDIMAATGHKKEETFLLYVRADQLTRAKGLAKHYQGPVMKVTKGGRAA